MSKKAAEVVDLMLIPNSNIPIYPNFKEFTSDDIPFVEAFTKEFPPLSDFVVSNLLNWRLKSIPTKVSMLNNNLVIKIADNYGKKIVASFIGKNKYVQTVEVLLNDNKKLYHIPEFIVENLKDKTSSLIFEEDRNNFDYIFDINRLTQINSPDLKTKKKEIKNFTKRNADIKVELLDLSNKEIQENMVKLHERWLTMKENKIYKNSSKCEFAGFKRFLENNAHFPYYCVGVYKNKELIGFMLNEVINEDYLLNCYTKGDLNYRGLFGFLTYKTAEYGKEKNFKYLNSECDLGIEGLRVNKLGWRPVNFLKKYKIGRKHI